MNWADYTIMFGIGFSCGFPVGLLCLAVRRIRLTLNSVFRQAVE